MKIALCFSGGIRNLKENYSSIKKSLLDPLKPDVFIHGWYFKVDELKNTHKMYRGKETEIDEVFSLLHPKKIKLEVYDKFKEEELGKMFKVKEVQSKYQDNTRLSELYPNTVGMFWSIYQANLLKQQYEKDNKFKYDIVIRVRPDFEFFTELNLQVLKLVEKNTLLMPLDNYAFITQQCDKFAISDSETMDYYSSLILSMNSYQDKFPNHFWDGPSILDKHLKEQNKIKIKWIYVDYDYNVRKKSQRLTKDKLEKLEYNKTNLLVLKPEKYNKL